MLWFLPSTGMPHRVPANTTGIQGGKRILILGDSTAVGVGATRPSSRLPEDSGKFLPTCEIRNLGQNGARTMDVLEQLEQVKNETFDLTIISVGGSDAWHFTSSGHSNTPSCSSLMRRTGSATTRVVPHLFQYRIRPCSFQRPQGYAQQTFQKIRDLFLHITTERGAYAIDLSTNNDSLKRHSIHLLRRGPNTPKR